METILSFFIPDIGTGILKALFSFTNLHVIMSAAVLLWLFLHNFTSIKTTNYKLINIKTAFDITFSIASVVLMCILGIYSPVATPPETSGISAALWFLLKILEPFFSISTIASNPFPYFTGINVSIRIFMLCVFILAFKLSYWAVQYCTQQFKNFLDEKIFSITAEVDIENSETSLIAKTENSNSKKKTINITFILKCLGGVSGSGAFFGYIFGSDSTRSSIETIFKALEVVLNATTLSSKVIPGAVDASVLISNFFYVILNICIIAVYIAIIIALKVFLVAAKDKVIPIAKWIASKYKTIFLFCGVLLVVVISCLVVFVASTEYSTFYTIISNIFKMGPSGIFETAGKFTLLILAICLILLMVGFLSVFACFIVHLVYKIITTAIKFRKKPSLLFKIAKKVGIAVGILGIILCLLFEYANIRDILLKLFTISATEDATPIWVICHILLLFVSVLAAIVTGICAFMLFKFLLSKLIHRITVVNTPFISFLNKATEFFARFCKTIGNSLGRLFSTLLGVFDGYDTEAKKNKALFIAACFASIASLLNTFFGLIDFYNDDLSLIPVICSFAIASAVQLAMLIFGMKAGEGIAENIILNNSITVQSYSKVIVSKVFRCVFYALIYSAAATIIVFYFFLSQGESFNIKAAIPIILLLLATAVFLYALILQIIDIRTLSAAKKAISQNAANNSFPLSIKNPKRLSPGIYMTAYLLLMIVSTGFAFNNLFGYYAEKADLHEQVYDQVRYQTDIALDINTELIAMIDEYNGNTNDILDLLEARVSDAKEKRENDIAKLKSNISGKTGEEKNTAENYRDNYEGETKDFTDVVAALKTYINMDYTALGNDVTVTINSYGHYWGNQPQPAYTTYCIVIKDEDDDIVYIGNNIPEKKINILEMSVIRNDQVENVEYNLSNRYVDPNSI